MRPAFFPAAVAALVRHPHTQSPEDDGSANPALAISYNRCRSSGTAYHMARNSIAPLSHRELMVKDNA